MSCFCVNGTTMKTGKENAMAIDFVISIGE